MPIRLRLPGPGLALIALSCGIVGQEAASWKDPSSHDVRLVTVEPGVVLEVLDWGGTGRPLVLLAGAGNTAHVFDDFAPRLRSCCHVYGLTRRGYGSSSRPASGYDEQQLADDVLHALEALALRQPILVGHSMAGGEMTTLGRQHPARVAGLVYLDALADPRDAPGADPAYRELLERLPAPMRIMAPPSSLEAQSFAGFQRWQVRTQGVAFPESELRATLDIEPDGSPGRPRAPRNVFDAIGAGQRRRDYVGIGAPVLAFLELPRPSYDPRLDRYAVRNQRERAAIEAVNGATAIYIERWMNGVRAAVRDVRFVNLPGAGHFVFLTRPAEVAHDLQSFVRALPSPRQS